MKPSQPPRQYTRSARFWQQGLYYALVVWCTAGCSQITFHNGSHASSHTVASVAQTAVVNTDVNTKTIETQSANTEMKETRLAATHIADTQPTQTKSPQVKQSNAPSTDTEPTDWEWHHHGLFNFIEISAPVDLDERCRGGDWQWAKTEFTFTNWVVGAIIQIKNIHPYGARTVTYRCADEPNQAHQQN